MKFTASQNYKTLLQLRLAICLVTAAFAVGVLAALNVLLSIIFAVIIVLLYGFAAVFYIRFFAQSLSVTVQDCKIVVKRGVLYSVTALLPLEHIRYVEIKSSPLGKLLDVFTVIAHTSSRKVKIYGLNMHSAQRLVRLAEENYIANRK